MRIFKLSPDEEERFFDNLPRFLFYYLFLFTIFWFGLTQKSAEEIRESILSGNVSPDFWRSTLVVLLLLAITDAYLMRKGDTNWNTPGAALFMLFGFFIMLLVVMYVGRASILFVVSLFLIYINTLIKTKEELRKKNH
ncbi:hypothetical protein [Pyrococcus horikoshii]|uniref:Uncharacterized protein n=2 Tax=Pyrococcus horikoshii TaxID=53953 RepID=O58445_PYRHO|nr:hypothetical protein [Pyrococcus horikoshii]BAA29805.1 137aa long hypothetical protein [Pyrococcus horikoshii OT3]HII61371.1 hypothetical protein [Pyrococcus horikoshii]